MGLEVRFWQVGNSLVVDYLDSDRSRARLASPFVRFINPRDPSKSVHGTAQVRMAREKTSNLEPGGKRRREDGILRARKKSRTAATASYENVELQDEALQLEEKILESRTNYNSIYTLLEYLQQEDELKDEKTIAAVALCRIFCRLMARGSLSKPQESSSNESMIMQWLRQRLREYERGLLRMFKSNNIGTQSIALTVLMRLLKEEASHLGQSADTLWQEGLFGQLVQTLIEEEVVEEIRIEFMERYVLTYEDVRYHTFACLAYVPKPI